MAKYTMTVTEVNRYIKDSMTHDLVLSNLMVKGEISNYKHHSSGHLYFTLKDEGSLMKVVMFKMQAMGVKFAPANGLKVIVKGYISVFERDGQYQLYAENMQPDGLGSLHLAFEQLKNKLFEEGLFDANKKKSLPELPTRIGVITSPTGAVIRDIIKILYRRFYHLNIKIVPVSVQGDNAVPQIKKAIELLNEKDLVDVIILARGGGSMEELWAFNEEVVARSIAMSRIPIISAIGHETDFTISDFVADLRAPTPSAAAELVVPEKRELVERILGNEKRLKNALLRKMDNYRNRLDRAVSSRPLTKPFERMINERQTIAVMERMLAQAVKTRIEVSKGSLGTLFGKLESLSPLAVLVRGYSYLKSSDTQEIIRSVSSVRVGELVDVILCDGMLQCEIIKQEEKI